MRSSRRLGRNEPCWCGSGKKFKHCHIGRAEERAENPFKAVKKLYRFNKKRVCLHPARGTACGSSGVIRAHTIQRATSLASIAENGHVLGFDADIRTLNKTNGRLALKPVGIRQASTFSGFCDVHDKTTFAPVEDTPFASTHEQCFLLGYRAMCRELYQKETLIDAAQFMRGLDAGRTLEEQAYWQSTLNQRILGQNAGYRDLQFRKTEYDAILVNHAFGDANWYVIEFGQVPDVMASFGLTVQYDFQGNQLQNLGDLNSVMESVYISTIATPTGGALVLSWIPATGGAVDSFVRSLAKVPDSDVSDAIVRLIFEHSENTFVRPSWWNGLREEVRNALLDRSSLACNQFAERSSDCLVADGHSYVNWTIMSRRSHIAGGL